MNQILSTENKVNKGNKKNKNNNLLDMRKVVVIFSILIILFALVILGAKGYSIIKEKINKNKPIELLNKPSITVEEVEQQCRIKIEYDEGISKIAYSWNNGDITERNMNGSGQFETLINIPNGNKNTLNITAIGIDESKNELTKVFEKENTSGDDEKIQIKWEQVSGTDDMIISVTSENEIENITYQWENDDAITIEGEGKNEIQLTVDIKRGTNKFYIIVNDIEGNSQTKEENIIGINYPEIGVYAEGDVLYMNVKHDMGFEKIIFRINGQEVIYDENSPVYDATRTEFVMTYNLKPGNTMVEIIAYSLEHEKSQASYRGQINR